MQLKGQGALETTILLAVGLIAIVAIAYMVRDSVGTFGQISDHELSRAALAELDYAATGIASQSVGARAEQAIELPAGAKNITFRNKTIELYFFGGKKITRNTDYSIYGNKTVSQGTNYIRLYSLEKGICFGEVAFC